MIHFYCVFSVFVEGVRNMVNLGKAKELHRICIIYLVRFLHKPRKKCLIYVINCKFFTAIYKGKTQQTPKKIMYGNFSNVQCLLKNRQKSDSFAAHCRQQFKYNISRTDLCNYMIFKVVKHLKTIESVKPLQKLTVDYAWRNL